MRETEGKGTNALAEQPLEPAWQELANAIVELDRVVEQAEGLYSYLTSGVTSRDPGPPSPIGASVEMLVRGGAEEIREKRERLATVLERIETIFK